MRECLNFGLGVFPAQHHPCWSQRAFFPVQSLDSGRYLKAESEWVNALGRQCYAARIEISGQKLGMRRQQSGLLTILALKTGRLSPDQLTRTEAMRSPSEFFQNIEPLPTAPTVLPKLLELLHDSNADLDQVTKLVELEPSLTVKVLKMCNTAHFAHCGTTADIPEAITRLGFDPVYMMVVAITGKSMLNIVGPDTGVDLQNLWTHSIVTSLAAEMIAADHQKDRAALFTAGLLHDFGKLILAAVFKGHYGRLLAQARQAQVSSIEMERRFYDVDHAELCGHLLQRWHFPDTLVVAVRDHHGPVAQDLKHPAGIISAASHLAYVLTEGGASTARQVGNKSGKQAEFSEEIQREYLLQLRKKMTLIESMIKP